jgi:soluble lytic murein transglycosylase
MLRVFSNFILTILLAGIMAAGILLVRSSDPLYTVQEWLNYSRFGRFDPLIEAAGKKYQVDPMLIKAIVWRESSFHPDKVGTKGERGLMQITPVAGNEWAKSQKIQTFKPTDLFDPKTNIEAGTWYFKQAFQRWSGKNDPIMFALAEYNAGRSNVVRWVASTKMGPNAEANDLKEAIKFPSTRSYVETIADRYRFYQKRGRL